jgi:hypothetical protein
LTFSYRLDGVVVINDKTDPDLPLPRAVDCTADKSKLGAVAELAVDCPANESKGGAVAELARNVSNPGNGERLVAWDVASPLAPKYGLIGGAAAASAAWADAAVSLSSSSSS